MTYSYVILLTFLAVFTTLPASSQTLAPGQDPNRRSQHVDVHYEDRARTRLTVEASAYEFTIDLTTPRVIRLVNRLGAPSEDMLHGYDLALSATVNGKTCDSRHAPKKARLNIWRQGLYYYEIHVLDFGLGSVEPDHAAAPVTGELVFYCFPEKFHVQAFLRPTEDVRVSAAGMNIESGAQEVPPSDLAASVRAESGGNAAIVTFRTAQAATQFYVPHRMTVGSLGPQELGRMEPGAWAAQSEYHGWFAVLPTRADEAAMTAALLPILKPLPPSAIKVEAGGTFTGYDPARGIYVFHIAQAPAPVGFEANWVSPNEYPGVRFTIHNDDLPRRLYVEQTSDTAGAVEAAVVCDENGWPLPIPVQTCKNFAGEHEEPDDTPYSESYFPLQFAPHERLTLTAMHLFQNWGNHPLKQISSIRFFEHYWHMSTGATETTCHVPFTKFAYPHQGFNIPDFRGMSGITWLGQPQHHHVALHGFLQYNDGEWHYLRYLGSTLDYVAPCFAQFTTRYVTDDDKVRVTITIFEAPQTDETRTFTHVRYDVDAPVQVAGDARQNFKLFTADTDITRNHYATVAWTGTNGEIKTRDFQYDDSWSLLGEPLGTLRPLYCMYPSDKSNNAYIVLKYAGQLGGKALEHLGASLAAYKNQVAEQVVTTTEPTLRLERGDWFEADLILMPYGDQTSDWHAPDQERTYYGANAPKIEVRQGEKVKDFPATVQARENRAEFILSGGHNVLPLIVQGMETYAVPLLWEETGGVWQWIDPQVRGGDGYQVQDGPNGGYEFVFVVKQRNGMSHHYLVTQAHAEGGIATVTQQNQCLIVTGARRSRMQIVSPRLFVGFDHTLHADSPAIEAVGEAREAAAAPMTAQNHVGTAHLTLQRYTPSEVRFRVEGTGALTLVLAGLKPEAAYRFHSGQEDRSLSADRSGMLHLDMTLDGAMEASLLLGPDRL